MYHNKKENDKMKKPIVCLIVLVMSLAVFHSGAVGDEVLLKNGQKIDYGPTWEKDGMIWFNFHDFGVVGISKTAVVDKKGFLGSVKANQFISTECECTISVPPGWRAANAVQALDFMPMSENERAENKKLQPREIMGNMGFLVTLLEGDSWSTTQYNPNMLVKVEEKAKYPGVNAPIDYLRNSQFLLSSLYKNFKLITKPQPFVLNNMPSARQKFSCNVIVNDKPYNITQWQYAFIRKDKVYVVSALNTSDNFKATERLFVKTLKSFRFID